MRRVAAGVMAAIAVFGMACGGDNPSIARPGGPADGTGGEPSTDVGERAPVGEVVLEVDGRTFRSSIAECLIQEGAFVVVPQRGETEVTANANRVGEAWAVSAGVTVNGQIVYLGSSAGGVTPAIDGQSLALSIEFGRLASNSVENAGRGRLSATCPAVAVATNPGGAAAPNTIQIGERVWTRTNPPDVGQCFLQAETQGLPESASVWGYLDNNEDVRFSVALSQQGVASAQVTSPTYFWSTDPGIDGTEINLELDYDSQTIRGTATFFNIVGGTLAPGSFEFECEE